MKGRRKQKKRRKEGSKKERKKDNSDFANRDEIWCCFIFLHGLSFYVIPKRGLQNSKVPPRIIEKIEWECSYQYMVSSFDSEHLERMWTKLDGIYLPQGQAHGF